MPQMIDHLENVMVLSKRQLSMGGIRAGEEA
jgi:hypothetical protein